jgi:iron complex transport system substrate-binding protein
LALALALAAGLAAGLAVAASPVPASAPWTVQDDEGRVLELPAPARRIVSLSPGATAMLFGAGAGNRVVGTAEYSLEPEAARAIARVGDAHGFDLERILALHPDLVVAWPQGSSVGTLAQLERLGLKVYHHRLQRLDALPMAIERLGRVADTAPVAAGAAAALRVRINALRAAHAQATPRTILLQLWDEPVFTVGGGQVLSDVLAACGYRNAFADLGGASPVVSREAVVARDPDAILALTDSPQGGEQWLARWRALGALRAVRSGHLWAWGDPRLTRMGPQIVDAAEALCRALDAGMPPGYASASAASPEPKRPPARQR